MPFRFAVMIGSEDPAPLGFNFRTGEEYDVADLMPVDLEVTLVRDNDAKEARELFNEGDELSKASNKPHRILLVAGCRFLSISPHGTIHARVILAKRSWT
jgi:hypothetical protein